MNNTHALGKMIQVFMNISGRHLRKYLLNKRATNGIDGQPVSIGGGPSSSAAAAAVAAVARLLPVPWDIALGYGNPKREVWLRSTSMSLSGAETSPKGDSLHKCVLSHILLLVRCRST